MHNIFIFKYWILNEIMKLSKIIKLFGSKDVNTRIKEELGFRGAMKLIPEAIKVKKFWGGVDFYKGIEHCRVEITRFAKQNPQSDKLVRGTQTLDLICRTEERALEKGWVYAFQEALRELNINYSVIGKENIPEKGPALLCSNHPWGIPDPLVLFASIGDDLNKKNEKLKFVGTHVLRMIRNIEDIVIFVDLPVTGSEEKAFRQSEIKPNISSVREVMKYFQSGGYLTIFPSGQPSGPGLKDYPWMSSLGKLSTLVTERYAGCIVPMWFSGPDHDYLYSHLAKEAPELRQIAGLRNAWNLSGKTITLNIGKPIYKNDFEKISSDNGKRTAYLRQKAEGLKL
jgi:putative hemolysin